MSVRRAASYAKGTITTSTSGRALAFAALAAIVVAAALVGTASAAPLRGSAAEPPCLFVAQGASWTFKGQKGKAYTFFAENGAKCSTARAWATRFTHERAAFDLKSVPANWHCSAIGDYSGLAKLGQCTTHSGGIVEWLPKLKK